MLERYRSVILPHQARECRVYFWSLPSEVDLIPLPPELDAAVPKRQMQFRAGRYCAMRAMAAFDRPCASRHVGRSTTGAPLWPDGLVGSITHTDDFASAAVAMSDHAASVGIDAERIMSASQVQRVGCLIAWPAEVAHARAAGLSRLEAFTLVFSAKESIFKCLHPMVTCYFDFHDVRIVEIDGQARTFTAVVKRTLSEAFPAATILRGSFDFEGPWVHTGIALSA